LKHLGRIRPPPAALFAQTQAADSLVALNSPWTNRGEHRREGDGKQGLSRLDPGVHPVSGTPPIRQIRPMSDICRGYLWRGWGSRSGAIRMANDDDKEVDLDPTDAARMGMDGIEPRDKNWLLLFLDTVDGVLKELLNVEIELSEIIEWQAERRAH